jgi:hypothetical protein
MTVVSGRVHRLGGVGLTQEVRALLKRNPLRWFALAEVVEALTPGHTRAEVNSALHKLAHDCGLVDKGSRHNGWRTVNTWKWKV